MPSFLDPLRRVARMDSRAPSEDEGVAPLDVIFSCSVCGDTFAEVYDGHSATVKGLSDGVNSKDRLVTKLYLSACCHVICIKHIESGNGPAFHSAETRARAFCPVCVNEGAGDQPRELYSVRGFKDGEYDPAIPKSWFSAPPMKLDGKDKDMEALRFQYLALIRYSKSITATLKDVKKRSAKAESKLRDNQDCALKERAKVIALEREVQRLRSLEPKVQELHRFKARLPAVEHYLRLLPRLVEQNDLMQQRLASLGFQMVFEPIPNYKDPFPLDGHGNLATEDFVPTGAGLHHTGREPTHDTRHVEDPEVFASPQTHRPLKRARHDSPISVANSQGAPSSRDRMPPPAKPISRMNSVRKIIPTIRKKIRKVHASTTVHDRQNYDVDVQVYDNDNWETVNPAAKPSSRYERSPSHYRQEQQSPYMSGALPVAYSQQTETPFHAPLPSNPGMSANEGSCKVRKLSPIRTKSHQSSGLPTQPSYIRLLDGLGRDPGLDFGLEDPRERCPSRQASAHQDTQSAYREQIGRGTHHKRPRELGYALPHQSPNRTSSTAYRRPGAFRADSPDSPDLASSDTLNGITTSTITPTLDRSQGPMKELDHVVSPFFKSSGHSALESSQGGVAEQQDSLGHYVAYPSHQQGASSTPAANWRKPHSLNGLSFFDTPLNGRNEPIQYRQRQRPSEHTTFSREYQVQTLTPRSYIKRPEMRQSGLRDDSTNTPLYRPLYSRHKPVQHRAASPFRVHSTSRPSQSRATSRVFVNPSTDLESTPNRARSQGNTLELTGARFSQGSRSQFPKSQLASPTRNLFSSSGRRSVRR